MSIQAAKKARTAALDATVLGKIAHPRRAILGRHSRPTFVGKQRFSTSAVLHISQILLDRGMYGLGANRRKDVIREQVQRECEMAGLEEADAFIVVLKDNAKRSRKYADSQLVYACKVVFSPV